MGKKLMYARYEIIIIKNFFLQLFFNSNLTEKIQKYAFNM
jgi:hypothetical protein